MPRKRMIDPSIWEDENFGRLSPKSRLLFIGLFSNADDDGYLRANDAFLRSTIFMYDDMTLTAVRQLSDEVAANCGGVHFYEIGDDRFVHLTKWEHYQTQRAERRVPTTIPTCTICNPISDVSQMSDTSQSNVSAMSAQDKISKVKLREDKRREEMPAHASINYLLSIPTEDLEELQTKFNLQYSSITRKAEDLYNFCLSKGKTYKNYKAFLAAALSRDADQLRAKEKSNQRRVTGSRVIDDQTIENYYGDGTKEVVHL